MKRFSNWLVVALLALALFSAPAHARHGRGFSVSGGTPPAPGQNVNGSTYLGTGSTLSTGATSSPTNTGSTFVVWSVSEGSSAASGGATVSDTINGSASGNSWTHTLTDVGTSASGTWFLNLWTCQNCNGGISHVFILHCGATAAMTETVLQALEVKNVAASSLDQTNSTNAVGGPTFASASITPTQTGEFVLAVFTGGTGSATPFSAPTNGFTIGGNAFYTGTLISGWAYLVDSAMTSINTTVTLSGASGYGYSNGILSLIP